MDPGSRRSEQFWPESRAEVAQDDLVALWISLAILMILKKMLREERFWTRHCTYMRLRGFDSLSEARVRAAFRTMSSQEIRNQGLRNAAWPDEENDSCGKQTTKAVHHEEENTCPL
jgi:hypothetical protein